jgi:L-ascorbate 6-phosphate lactonase
VSLTSQMGKVEMVNRALGFWGLGQVGVAIKGPTGVLYVDPYLIDSDGEGGRLERSFPPPLEPEEVTNASAVLLTHDHIDHTDPETLLPLASASPQARFVCPFTSRDTLVEAGLDGDRITVPEISEPLEVAGASVTAVPSAHTELERDPERGYPYLGYVIDWNGVTLYHAGDTVIYDGLIETLDRWKIDVAFVPINGRDFFRTREGIVGNTDYREAAHLAEELDFGLVVPTHFDLFAFNAVDPGLFAGYLHRLNHERRHKFLSPGELLYFVREST